MTNGIVIEQPAERQSSVQFDLGRLSYGDLRRLQTVDATTPDGLLVVDHILEKAVIGGLDAIPILEMQGVITDLMAALADGMSGRGQPAAPYSPD